MFCKLLHNSSSFINGKAHPSFSRISIFIPLICYEKNVGESFVSISKELHVHQSVSLVCSVVMIPSLAFASTNQYVSQSRNLYLNEVSGSMIS